MKENNVGFTLIELLVVVLIIGILASVALPQYQKAVERSRMAEAMQRLGDYASAQQVYYMHNNGFASDYAALNQGDIKVPEQTGVGNWDTDDSRWSVSSASGSSLEKIEMSAQRMSGIYKGCVLTLSVESDGHIEKTCSGNVECCAAAKNGGYGEATPSSSNQTVGWGGSGLNITYNGETLPAAKGYGNSQWYAVGGGDYWAGASRVEMYGSWLGASHELAKDGTWNYADGVWYYEEPGVFAGYVTFDGGDQPTISHGSWGSHSASWGSNYWLFTGADGTIGSISFTESVSF